MPGAGYRRRTGRSLLDHADDDADSYAAAYEAVRGAVTLHRPDGSEVPEFLLHIDGAGVVAVE